MGKGYIPLFFDLFDETEDLTDEEFGRLIRAAGSYASGKDDWIDIVTGNEKYAFRFLRGQIDRNIEISKARARARLGKKEQPITNDNKAEQKETKKDKKTETSVWFDKFWDAYPRHVNKQTAKRAFDKLKVDEEMLGKLLEAIESQKQSTQWQENEGQFIPHPATWLNGHRWEDEVRNYKQTGKIKTVIAQQYTQNSYDGEQEDAEKRWMETMMEEMKKA